jgi:hypothetical protein
MSSWLIAQNRDGSKVEAGEASKSGHSNVLDAKYVSELHAGGWV